MVRILIVLGCGCQALGVGLVFWQIARAEDLFPGVARWWARVVRAAFSPSRWLLRMIHKPRIHTVQLSAQISATSSMSAEGRVLRARTGTSTEQLASLWKSVDDLYQEIDARRLSASKDRAEVHQKLGSLREELTGELQRQVMLLQQASLGSRWLQVFGAGLIILGIGLLGAAA